VGILTRNIVATTLGRGWGAVLQLVSVPLYVKFLGVEAFGLLGLFMSIQAVVSLLDLGLSPTITRELARLSRIENGAQEARNLVRTFEVIYWAMAMLLFLSLFVVSPLIAEHWVKTDELSEAACTQAFRLMAIYLMFQWPVTLYSSGLMGLQVQVLLNVANACFAALRTLGGLAVIMLVAPRLEAVLLWNVVCVFLNVTCLRILLWQRLPTASTASGFDRALLLKVWRFCAGVTGTTVMSVFQTQTDKLLLSKMVSLRDYGYYSMASMVAAALSQIVGPISTAVFPRLSQLVGGRDAPGLHRTFHISCQLVSAIVFPVALVLILFSEQILLLWTGNYDISRNSHVLTGLLVAGSALNAMMTIPFTLQYAEGRTRPVFLTGLCGSILFAPAVYWLAGTMGLTGAAVAWLLLNLGFVFLAGPFFFARSIPGGLMSWYRDDLALPFGAGLAVVLLARACLGTPGRDVSLMVSLATISCTAIAVSFMAAPLTRQYIREKYESIT